MGHTAMMTKLTTLYNEYQKLAKDRASKKRAKDFDEKCNAFEKSLDEVFHVPPKGDAAALSLNGRDAEIHVELKACV